MLLDTLNREGQRGGGAVVRLPILILRIGRGSFGMLLVWADGTSSFRVAIMGGGGL